MNPGRPQIQAGPSALEARLGHTFAQPALLALALTHRSHSADHNERLEFLGDSVLNLAISDLLYGQLKDLPEGDLSRIRANLVKQDTLVQLATGLGLPGLVRLGEGELKSGGRDRPSILADALEAIIGAVYLDAGGDAANRLVWHLYRHVPLNPGAGALGKDAKTALQEWLQARKMQLPAYRVAQIRGAAHQQTFEVLCEVSELQLGETGQGASRRAAEQAAAQRMLTALKGRKR